ncbi:unnamed protein product [Cuscuta epithymum]|uniref:Uncharacterized protein n=1 Tax=Cuscuta epithymum TaxID=186058 RepID=A0AAV0D440_9ASTE|nr:unnamed protein product [Cuscuta epithymum]
MELAGPCAALIESADECLPFGTGDELRPLPDSLESLHPLGEPRTDLLLLTFRRLDPLPDAAGSAAETGEPETAAPSLKRRFLRILIRGGGTLRHELWCVTMDFHFHSAIP